MIVLGLTWEYTLITTVFSLANGGTAGAIWLTLIVCCGMATVTLSFAEMASMAPTSGGMRVSVARSEQLVQEQGVANEKKDNTTG